MIKSPETIIFNTLTKALNAIRLDYSSAADKQKTLLYYIFGTTQLERYNFFEQSKTVVLAPKTNPRFLDINMFFNSERAHIPTIHITLPGENSGQNGLGIDQNFNNSPIYDDDNDTIRESLTRRFDSSCEIVVTSDNTNEVLLIYHLLKALTISLFDSFNILGIENVKIGGRDLNLTNNIVPKNIFVRSLTVSFSYDIDVPQLFTVDQINSLLFSQTIIENE